jgi:hypothetical protein
MCFDGLSCRFDNNYDRAAGILNGLDHVSLRDANCGGAANCKDLITKVQLPAIGRNTAQLDLGNGNGHCTAPHDRKAKALLSTPLQ